MQRKFFLEGGGTEFNEGGGKLATGWGETSQALCPPSLRIVHIRYGGGRGWYTLESWSTMPIEQVARVMAWLGLESWSRRLNCSFGDNTR